MLSSDGIHLTAGNKRTGKQRRTLFIQAPTPPFKRLSVWLCSVSIPTVCDNVGRTHRFHRSYRLHTTASNSDGLALSLGNARSSQTIEQER